MGAQFPMDVQSAPGVTPGPEPGQLWINGVGYVDAKSWTQDILFDTEQLPAGNTPAGTTYNFFRSTAFQLTGVRKSVLDTNIVVAQQLPSGWQMYVYGMGYRVAQRENVVGAGIFTSPADVQRILAGGFGQFMTGNQKIEREGPLETWPCPVGLTGPIMRTGAAATTWSSINNGVASMGAMPPMDITINLSRELTFEGSVTFPIGITLDAACFLQLILFGYVAKPVR